MTEESKRYSWSRGADSGRLSEGAKNAALSGDNEGTRLMQDEVNSCSTKDTASSGPKKKHDGSCLPKIFGVIVMGALCLYFFSQTKAPSKVERYDRPEEERTPHSDWRRAESNAEVLKRIQERIVRELGEVGLGASHISNIVANAKMHPTRLVAGVPEHKRTRLLLLATNEEAVIARKMVAEYKNANRFKEDANQLSRVREIAERLVAVVPEIDSVPDIYILKDDSVNACCLPGGTIFVNSGTLKEISDDSVLAAIIAHELGHAAARHGNEDLTRMCIGAAGGVAFEEWLTGVAPVLNSGEGVSLIRLAYGLGGTVGFRLPRDRRQEAEADRLGVRYLARAGFDPEVAVRLFEVFKKIDPQKPSVLISLLSTHPVNDKRIEHVRRALAEPDLYEMPKVGLGSKLKHRADEVDFTKIDLKASVTNVTGRLGKHPRGDEQEESATNQPQRAKRFKLPWRRQGVEKEKDATEPEN